MVAPIIYGLVVGLLAAIGFHVASDGAEIKFIDYLLEHAKVVADMISTVASYIYEHSGAFLDAAMQVAFLIFGMLLFVLQHPFWFVVVMEGLIASYTYMGNDPYNPWSMLAQFLQNNIRFYTYVFVAVLAAMKFLVIDVPSIMISAIRVIRG